MSRNRDYPVKTTKTTGKCKKAGDRLKHVHPALNLKLTEGYLYSVERKCKNVWSNNMFIH